MLHPRRIGILLSAVGGLLLAGGALLWGRGAVQARRVDATRAALGDSVRSVRSQITGVSLRFQALERSISAIPDSIRAQERGRLYEVALEQHRRIQILELRERDLKLQIAAFRRRADAIRSRAWSSAAPIGIPGLVVLITGLVLARAARERRDGA